MAVIYNMNTVGGLDAYISDEPEVKAAVVAEAQRRGGIARGVLAAHFYTGASSIEVTGTGRDAYITLDAGTGDARSIEYGRNGARGKGTSTGVGALQAAMGAG